VNQIQHPEKTTECQGISEIAVYFPRWPGDFQGFLQCWRNFNEKSIEKLSSNVKVGNGINYDSLLSMNEITPPRIYFGNEFCEHCIPHVRMLKNVLAAIKEFGFSLTLLTPPCNDKKLGEVEKLLKLLEELAPDSEVVGNDWGVLEMIKCRYSKLKPVFGRLMNRFLRDPRITPRYLCPDAPPKGLKVVQGSSLSIPDFQHILKMYGIERVELDYLYQGIGIDFPAIGFLPSVYLPFGFVATGRICMFGNLNKPPESKFGINDTCDKPCWEMEVMLEDANKQNDGGVYTYLQRGNTIFYTLNELILSKAITWANKQQARIVYQPELPF
jgi:hypothetical protein